MRLRQVTLREIHMPLVAPFETSFGRTVVRRILLVQADTDGATGWGECVAGETPFYAPETVETAWHILRYFIWRALRGREFAAAADVWGLLAQIRGHNMAKGSLEAATWDAEAREKGTPLWKLIGGVRDEIACGVSIGIQKDDDELVAVVERELAAGYQRIKIKNQAGARYRTGLAPAQEVSPHSSDGGRQQRVSPGRQPRIPQNWKPIFS